MSLVYILKMSLTDVQEKGSAHACLKDSSLNVLWYDPHVTCDQTFGQFNIWSVQYTTARNGEK